MFVETFDFFWNLRFFEIVDFFEILDFSDILDFFDFFDFLLKFLTFLMVWFLRFCWNFNICPIFVQYWTLAVISTLLQLLCYSHSVTVVLLQLVEITDALLQLLQSNYFQNNSFWKTSKKLQFFETAVFQRFFQKECSEVFSKRMFLKKWPPCVRARSDLAENLRAYSSHGT